MAKHATPEVLSCLTNDGGATAAAHIWEELQRNNVFITTRDSTLKLGTRSAKRSKYLRMARVPPGWAMNEISTGSVESV